MWQKRPVYTAKEAPIPVLLSPLFLSHPCALVLPTYMAKEAYLYGKRGLFIRQKRPIYTAKDAYL